MALTPGTRLGHYDVTALLGEGGMGQVWQATDTQLGRQVALKILPDAFAADPDRLARFTREAQILASLNHPNIAAIYGIEEAEGTWALVLELVEGPTLADRISKGPIPLDEALPIAKQIAEALEAAPRPGIRLYAKPELVATGPNQVWSWDITNLKGPIPYLYFSLYVILDLFSRYAVGWMVALHENAHLADRLIAATCLKQGIAPHHLTIHADRGAPMRSTLVALLFSDLGIDASHSRPRVSNDNPFSEAQFRTIKYRPEFPDRFGSLARARDVSRDLFAWYNDAHHHSGISYLTPADVHFGRAAQVLQVRQRTRLVAYAAHPERFVKGPPRPETLPTAVWINRPPRSTRQDAPGATIVTPDDPQHGVIRRSPPISDDRSITRVTSVESLQ